MPTNNAEEFAVRAVTPGAGCPSGVAVQPARGTSTVDGHFMEAELSTATRENPPYGQRRVPIGQSTPKRERIVHTISGIPPGGGLAIGGYSLDGPAGRIFPRRLGIIRRYP
jgi:hypothetical protein